jgi:chemotaxis protein CheD
MSSPFAVVDRASGLRLTIEVADMKASKDPNAHLITFALGSCVGLTVYDPVAKVGGLLHFMLPKPSRRDNPDDRKQFMYGATGIPLLFQKVYELGGQKSRLKVCARRSSRSH